MQKILADREMKRISMLDPKHFAGQLDKLMSKEKISNIEQISTKAKIGKATIYNIFNQSTKGVQRSTSIMIAEAFGYSWEIVGDKFYFKDKDGQYISGPSKTSNILTEQSGNFDIDQITALLRKNPDLIDTTLTILREYDNFKDDREDRLSFIRRVLKWSKNLDDNQLKILIELFLK